MVLSYTGQRQRLLRQQVLTLLGGKCAECGFFDESVLQIDHVQGKRGIKEPTGPQMYAKILRNGDKQNYQLLCPNCNWIKRHTNAEIGFNPDSQFRRAQKRAFEVLGSRCSVCGESDFRCLQVDHKLGQGYKERKRLGAATILVKARNNPDEYQVLCATCNWLKRVQNKEHVKPKTNSKRPAKINQQAGIRLDNVNRVMKGKRRFQLIHKFAYEGLSDTESVELRSLYK
jgi:hypothetical protein